MRVTGNPDELERFFKKRKRKEVGIFRTIRELEPARKKTLVLIGLVCCMIGLLFFLLSLIYQGFMTTKYITQSECTYQIKKFVIDNLHLPWYNILWLKIIPYIPLLVIAIALGWIFNGVGFRII